MIYYVSIRLVIEIQTEHEDGLSQGGRELYARLMLALTTTLRCYLEDPLSIEWGRQRSCYG